MSLADRLYDGLSSVKKGKIADVFIGTEQVFHTDFLKTGIASIDWILGGGFAYGRTVELFGNYSSGKTYLLYKALAANQKNGGASILFESEGAFNPEFYQICGGDPTTLILIPVSKVEDVFNMIRDICERARKDEDFGNTPICIGWDSIALTGTRHLEETGLDKVDMTKALRMSQGTAYIQDEVQKTKICVIATNQTREKIGSKDSSTHTPGGNAWGFSASQRVELKFDGGSKTSLIRELVRVGGEKGEGEEIGRWIKVAVVKNKCGPPFLTCSLPYYNFNDYEHPLFGYATKVGVDPIEALWDFYLNSRYFLVNTLEKKERVVQIPSQGWYALHPLLDPEQKKFRQADWPNIIQSKPILCHLPQQVSNGYTEQPTPAAGEQTETQPGT